MLLTQFRLHSRPFFAYTLRRVSAVESRLKSSKGVHHDNKTDHRVQKLLNITK